MASHCAFLIFVLLANVPLAALAREYIVGDESGWTTGFNYQTWGDGKSFQVGDKLVFQYPAGAHNVFKVNGTAFQNCIVPPLDQALTTGNDTITLLTPGKKWYICGVSKHCELGQKLAITVKSYAPNPAPSIAPSPSCAPYVQVGQDLPESEEYYTPAPSPGMAPSPHSGTPCVLIGQDPPAPSPSMAPSPQSGTPCVQIGQELSETEEYYTPAPSPSMAPSPQSGTPCVQIDQELSETEEYYTPAPSPSMAPSPQSGAPYIKIIFETPAPSPSMPPTPQSGAPYVRIVEHLFETPAPSPSMAPPPQSSTPYVQIGQDHETEEYYTPALSPNMAPSPLSGMPYVHRGQKPPIAVAYDAPAPSPVSGMPYTGASTIRRPFIKLFK